MIVLYEDVPLLPHLLIGLVGNWMANNKAEEDRSDFQAKIGTLQRIWKELFTSKKHMSDIRY